MNKNILYILLLIGLLSFSACSNKDNPLLYNGTGEIRFYLVDTTEVGITTRALPNINIDELIVSLSRGGTPIFSNRKYSDIKGSTFSCSVASNYLLTAENCNESEAESANNGWGQPRVLGVENFAVVANETKNVIVDCGLVNSSVNVEFSDFVESMFSTYSIELHATDATDRTFTFDQSNNKYKVAYFNVNEFGRELSYTVTLPPPYKVYTKTISIDSSKCYTLSVKVENDDNNSTVLLGLIVDGTLIGEEILIEGINPYV